MLYRDGETRGDPNNNSVVVRLDLGPRRILLAGDAEGGNRIRPEDVPTSVPSANSIEAKLLRRPELEAHTREYQDQRDARIRELLKVDLPLLEASSKPEY